VLSVAHVCAARLRLRRRKRLMKLEAAFRRSVCAAHRTGAAPRAAIGVSATHATTAAKGPENGALSGSEPTTDKGRIASGGK
jgi:hypothetical protein